jgi:hypothetical protein
MSIKASNFFADFELGIDVSVPLAWAKELRITARHVCERVEFNSLITTLCLCQYVVSLTSNLCESISKINNFKQKFRKISNFASIAQLGERGTEDAKAECSIHSRGTISFCSFLPSLSLASLRVTRYF